MAQVMQQVMELPDGKIGELNLFSSGNCQDVLTWNNKQWTRPGTTVVEVIHRIATENPHETAIDSWDNKLSYSQLDDSIRRLGYHLRCAGVGPGVMVPVYFPRSASAIVAELAVMDAGGAFVPIDPSHPPQRARSIVDQTRASIGLVAPPFVDQMERLVEHVIVVSPKMLSDLSIAEDSITPVPGDMPAYVLFTSGSTGQPKGCVVHHEALANVVAQAGALHLEPGSRALQFASYSFGVSLIEIYCTLVRRATICIPSEEDRLNRLAEVMQEMRISWAYLTTATASSLRPTVDLPNLKTLILTGEPLGNHLIETWSHKVQLLQAFGFTEWAGVFCVSAPIHSPADKRTIGTSPTANCWLLDVEDPNRLAPIGAVAELAVEGPALANGYLNNTLKTAASFLERPEWPGIMRPGAQTRIYRTGDLVRYQSDGSIQYLTRRDTQVKVRGMRVELGEVEYQIRQAVPQLDRAIVEAAIPLNQQGGPILVAFLYSKALINSTNEAPADIAQENPLLLTTAPKTFGSWVDEIEQFLHHALPDYMCPMAYCGLKSVPMTISGKVDRLSLRALIGTQTRDKLESYRSPPAAKVPPRTEGEKRLHRLFSAVLHINEESFGVFDHFFRLGGDSLLAIHMVNRAREQHLHGLTVSDILQHQTVANLVLAMNHADSLPMSKAKMSPDLTVRPSDLTAVVPNITKAEDIFPCSPIQEGILLSQIRNRDHYQMRFVWQISATNPSSSLDIHRLERAWRLVCTRHSMLRTQFYTHASPQHFAIQVVRPELQNGVTVVHEGPDDPKQLIHSAPATNSKADGTSGPQLVLFARSLTCVWAVLQISHAMVDAVSTSIIMRDLEWLYDHDSIEQPTISLNPPSRYRDYVTYLAHLDHEDGLGFWKSHLGGIEPCVFPRLQDSTEGIGKQHLQYVPIELGDLDGHRRFCLQHGVTLATIARLAWALVLRAFTGSDDVCFGFMTAGRDAPLSGIDQAVGPYINMMVSRINFAQATSLLQIIQGVQSDLTQVWKYQWVPFSRVQHELDLKGDRMFNTSMTFPPQESRSQADTSSIAVKEIYRADPTEVSHSSNPPDDRV